MSHNIKGFAWGRAFQGGGLPSKALEVWNSLDGSA